ncbi:hypothetical protein RDI58_005123 [Solanum bulbocastanum]|uniref:Reverse transcriptase Ty1/copia-type domain-containing protein n=1 Tax=Solanum bulbocastanum TaxID=147425 RepID=A0AAN8U763_SOLBU
MCSMFFYKGTYMMIFTWTFLGNFRVRENKVCRLTKSLYGLKQSPRQWNAKLSQTLLKLEFKQSEYDHSLFIKKTTKGMVLVFIYVDDMLISGSSLLLIEETKDQLKQAFKIKNFGELKYFLGIEFVRSKQCILTHQRKYALELISETSLSAAKPARTPIDTNSKLTTRRYDEETQMKKPDPLTDQGVNQLIVGKLLYLTMTRRHLLWGSNIKSIPIIA